MFPSSEGLNLDLTAISGICGSISIACWLVVFTPQILENFRRGSADGLSIQFIMVWLTGDVCNILGAVLQGVLPTMIILAVYYAICDTTLLLQCFYYRGFTWRDEVGPQGSGEVQVEHRDPQPSERTALLHTSDASRTPPRKDHERVWASAVDPTHLSPAVPLLDPSKTAPLRRVRRPMSTIRIILINIAAVLLVCVAGVLGWWLSLKSPRLGRGGNEPNPTKPPLLDDSTGERSDLQVNVMGQTFGVLCAILYLSSRLPQLLLNYRRKSTEGISILFFIFACVGNLTYVLSIFAYEPKCINGVGHLDSCKGNEGSQIYARYILINASWIAGSLGTLFLDFAIFTQFFVYHAGENVAEPFLGSGADVQSDPADRQSDRPLLSRNDSQE